MAKVHQPSKEGDSEDFVIRLDPREWDGTFSGEGKGANDSYDDDHTIASIRANGTVLFQEKAKGLMTAMMMTISSALIRVSGKVSSLRSRPRSRYWNPKLSMVMNF